MKVITISRQFGSGGRTVGKKVAERLGIPFYDRELVEKVAEESGFSKDFVEQSGEYASSSNNFIYNLSLSSGIYNKDMLTPSDRIFVVQSKIIEDLADKGPCVIVGRCADYILKDRPHCLHVFVHADMESRAERIVTLYGEQTDTPLKRLKKKDKTRKLYYKHYTLRAWGDMKNYDLTLNSGKIGIDACVNAIVAAAANI